MEMHDISKFLIAIQFEVFKQHKLNNKIHKTSNQIRYAIDTFANFRVLFLLCLVFNQFIVSFDVHSLIFEFIVFCLQDREKIPKQHLGDTVEELKRFNARRKLKGAVQAIAGGLANDPLCGTDTDSGEYPRINICTF